MDMCVFIKYGIFKCLFQFYLPFKFLCTNEHYKCFIFMLSCLVVNLVFTLVCYLYLCFFFCLFFNLAFQRFTMSETV